VPDLSESAKDFFTIMNLSRTIDLTNPDIDKILDFHGHECMQLLTLSSYRFLMIS
jgi:hypothetical protein